MPPRSRFSAELKGSTLLIGDELPFSYTQYIHRGRSCSYPLSPLSSSKPSEKVSGHQLALQRNVGSRLGIQMIHVKEVICRNLLIRIYLRVDTMR
jgi:hypothetical protein